MKTSKDNNRRKRNQNLERNMYIMHMSAWNVNLILREPSGNAVFLLVVGLWVVFILFLKLFSINTSVSLFHKF